VVSMDDGYPDLAGIIDFANFDFDKNTYRTQERTVLEPQLRALGYSRITWSTGESDSFGPLSRLCRTTSPDGIIVTFIYG